MTALSGGAPEQAPRWDLVDTEACGGRTSDLGYFLEVWAFIGEVGIENKSGAHGKSTRPRGAPQGGGHAPTLVGPTGLPSDRFVSPYFLYFPEKFSVDFHRIPRNFISTQKQHHGSSAENSVSPG